MVLMVHLGAVVVLSAALNLSTHVTLLYVTFDLTAHSWPVQTLSGLLLTTVNTKV